MPFAEKMSMQGERQGEWSTEHMESQGECRAEQDQEQIRSHAHTQRRRNGLGDIFQHVDVTVLMSRLTLRKDASISTHATTTTLSLGEDTTTSTITTTTSTTTCPACLVVEGGSSSDPILQLLGEGGRRVCEEGEEGEVCPVHGTLQNMWDTDADHSSPDTLDVADDGGCGSVVLTRFSDDPQHDNNSSNNNNNNYNNNDNNACHTSHCMTTDSESDGEQSDAGSGSTCALSGSACTNTGSVCSCSGSACIGTGSGSAFASSSSVAMEVSDNCSHSERSVRSQLCVQRSLIF